MMFGRLLESQGEFFVQQVPLRPPPPGAQRSEEDRRALEWHHGCQAG